MDRTQVISLRLAFGSLLDCQHNGHGGGGQRGDGRADGEFAVESDVLGGGAFSRQPGSTKELRSYQGDGCNGENDR